jgi:hypothetical protein
MTYVKDKKKFEKHFSDQLKKTYDIQGMPKTEGGETKIKVLGKEDGEKVAWTYFGELVIVSFPPSENFEGEPGPLVETVETVATTTEENSLAKTEGYKNFSKSVGKDHSLAVYVNTGDFLNEERMKELEQTSDPMATATAKWVKENVDGAGIGMHVEDNKAKVQAWFGFNEKTRKRLDKVVAPPSKAPFANLATQNTLAGFRMSVNWDEFWSLYKETLPEDDVKQLEKQIAQAGQMAGDKLDIQKDVIDQLSGNIGVFFYGANLGAIINSRARGMMGTVPHLGLIAAVEFKSEKALEKVVEGIVTGGKGAVERRPLQLEGGETSKDIDVLAVKNMKQSPGRLYMKGSTLAFSTTAISEQSMSEYFSGKREEGSLTEAEKLDLGEAFAADEKYNGLYVNVLRAKDHLMSQKDQNPAIAQMVQPAQEFLTTVQEMSLTTSVKEDGGYLTLTVDLVPGQGGDAESSDEASDKE